MQKKTKMWVGLGAVAVAAVAYLYFVRSARVAVTHGPFTFEEGGRYRITVVFDPRDVEKMQLFMSMMSEDPRLDFELLDMTDTYAIYELSGVAENTIELPHSVAIPEGASNATMVEAQEIGGGLLFG